MTSTQLTFTLHFKGKKIYLIHSCIQTNFFFLINIHLYFKNIYSSTVVKKHCCKQSRNKFVYFLFAPFPSIIENTRFGDINCARVKITLFIYLTRNFSIDIHILELLWRVLYPDYKSDRFKKLQKASIYDVN